MLIYLDQSDVKFIKDNYLNSTSILKIIRYLKDNKKVLVGDYLWPIKLETQIRFNHSVNSTKFVVGAIGEKWDLTRSVGFTPISTQTQMIHHQDSGFYNLPISNTLHIDPKDHIERLGYKYLFAFPVNPILHKSFVFTIKTC